MVFYAKAIALTSLLINIAQYGPEFHTTAFQYPREWRVGEIYSNLAENSAKARITACRSESVNREYEVILGFAGTVCKITLQI